MNRVLTLPHRVPDTREWALALLAGLAVFGVDFFLPTIEASLIVLGFIAVVTIFLRWQVALYLLAFSVPFSSLKEVKLGEVAISATDILVILLFLSWLLERMARHDLHLRPTTVFLPFLVFFSALALSITNARSLPLSLKEMAKWMEAFGVYLIVYTYLTQRQTTVLLGCMFTAGVLQALVGLYQFFALSGPKAFLVGAQYLRSYGTFNQPNPYAGYLGLLTPLSLGLLVGALRQKIALNPWRLALLTGVWGILTIALVLSLSRAAWLGYAAAFFTVVVVAGRRFFLPFLVALLTALLLLWNVIDFIPSQLTQRLFVVSDYLAVFDARLVTTTSENFAIVERIAIWQTAWDMFQSSPLLGVGIGNFDRYYHKFSLFQWDQPPGHAHNYYLNLLAETGIVGLLGYLFFWASVFLLCFGSLRKVRQRQKSEKIGPEPKGGLITLAGILLGVLGMVMALSWHNLFDSLFVQGMAVQFGMTLGLLGLAERNKVSENTPDSAEG